MDIRSKFPALAFPVNRCQCICLEDVNVALEDAKAFQFTEAAFDESIRNSFASMRCKHGEMLQVPTAGIVARHDAADEVTIDFANEAQTRIPLQIPIRRFARICISK